MNPTLKAALKKAAEFFENAAKATDATVFDGEFAKGRDLVRQIDERIEHSRQVDEKEQVLTDALAAYSGAQMPPKPARGKK